MPYYSITVVLQGGKVIKGVREDSELYIDQVWVKYKLLAERSYGLRLKSFNLVQIAKQSDEFKEYLKKLGGKRA